MEHHPRFNVAELPLTQSKIILGSFPTWSLTDPDLNKNESFKDKEVSRIKNGDIPFFYGSSSNRFWNWYKDYIDESISIYNIESIKNSLIENGIGITDMIIRCSRKDKSALDKHLTNRIYNHKFFNYPEKGEVLRILCTSKGVMNNMLLSNKFFKIHPRLSINIQASKDFEIKISEKFNGDLSLVRAPLYQKIDIESGGSIECLALPSPGSPFRRLLDFGFSSNKTDNTQVFLNNYLDAAFDWFR